MNNITFFDNLLQSIFSTLSRHDSNWMIRHRRLDTVGIFIFLTQLVGGGMKCGMRGTLTRIHLLWGESISNLEIAPSSLTRARKKIGWVIFRSLLSQVILAFEAHFDKKFLWKNHRIFAIDGTKVNIPAEMKKKSIKNHPRVLIIRWRWYLLCLG